MSIFIKSYWTSIESISPCIVLRYRITAMKFIRVFIGFQYEREWISWLWHVRNAKIYSWRWNELYIRDSLKWTAWFSIIIPNILRIVYANLTTVNVTTPTSWALRWTNKLTSGYVATSCITFHLTKINTKERMIDSHNDELNSIPWRVIIKQSSNVSLLHFTLYSPYIA